MNRILVVDDESRIRELISQYLVFEGYTPYEASNGKQAVDMQKLEQFDLIIMDIMMPIMDGLAAMREIRKDSNVPIILLTAKSEEYDRVMGFDFGADDYVPKPFSPRELMARVRAVLKRTNGPQMTAENIYRYKGMEINYQAYEFKINGEKVYLTPKEFDLLTYMIKNKGVVLSREKLLHEIWGYAFSADTRTVDTHVKMLRNNLGEYRECIKTVWGVGYRYDEK